MSDEQNESSRLVSSVVAGVVGFLTAGLIAGAVGSILIKQAKVRARVGWNLVPVVVASRDMTEGETVTASDIAQRAIPEQFATTSVVKPESAAYIIDQRLLVPVQAGDAMLWSHFETEAGQKVLVAAHDIPSGHALAAEDIVARRYPEKLTTPSFVADAQRPEIVGKAPIAPFREGDPILWTHFSGRPRPIPSPASPAAPGPPPRKTEP